MQEVEGQRERSFFLTFMTVVSCVAVVILHANMCFGRFPMNACG